MSLKATGAELEDCESPDPSDSPTYKCQAPPVSPSAPRTSPAKLRPNPPFRKAGSVESTVSTAEAGSDPGTAVTGASTGVAQPQYFGTVSPLAESEESTHGQTVDKGAYVDQEVVLRHINSLFAQLSSSFKVDELVDERIAAHGIEAVVAKHMEGFLEERLSDLVKPLVQKDVEVMIEANMATREIVDMGSDAAEDAIVDGETAGDVAAASAATATESQIEDLVKARFAERESEMERNRSEMERNRSEMERNRSEMERKVSEIERKVQEKLQEQVHMHEQLQEQGRLQEKLVQELKPVATSITLTRPPTSPRPFSAEHQAKTTSAQLKASWSSRALYTVNAVPNDDRALMHSSLEDDVTQKVLASQPDRSGLGYNEIVMRDIANSVVRELVGIFESLLDRLLIDKKEDTLRSMVAELVTEDTHKLWAVGSEQLRQREYGNLHRELERLGREARERDATWEKKFQITGDLQDSQDDLYTTLDERLKEIEARLGTAEKTSASREEIDNSRKELSAELSSALKQVEQARELSTSTSTQLSEHQQMVKENYVHWKEGQSMEARLRNELKSHVQELQQSIKDLKESSASKVNLAELQDRHEQRFAKVDTGIFEASAGISELHNSFRKSQKFHEDVFLTKVEHSQVTTRLETEAETVREKLQRKVDTLEAMKATKKELLDTHAELLSGQTQANATLSKHSSSLEHVTGLNTQLEQRIDQTMATRSYVDEKTIALMEEAIERSDAKEELGRLWKDLDIERDGLRQVLAQQQHLRQDINEAIETVEMLRQLTEKHSAEVGRLGEGFQSLDQRESQHNDASREALYAQKRTQEDLTEFHKALKEDFLSHKEYSRAEAERIKKHSTERYLEQIDKALNLSQSVEQVSKGQRELNDSIREIKLPKIVDKGMIT